MKKKIIRILCIMLVVLVFAGLAIASESDSDIDVSEATQQNSDDTDKETEATEKPEEKSEFKVGETINGSDLKITFLASGEYVSDNMFVQPKDGYKFIFLKLYCENVSSTDKFVSSASFECFADGYACDANYLIDGVITATISSGRSVNGLICFEVPTNSQKIEVEYDEGILFKKTYKLIYEGSKDSGITPSTKEDETKEKYKVGTILTSKTEKITYLSCGEYISDNMFIQPKDGNKYIYLEFEFENLASYDDLVSYFSFNCYADGVSCDSFIYGDDLLSATLSSGRKAKGKVYFEVPTSATSIEVEYDSSYWSSNKITFLYG